MLATLFWTVAGLMGAGGAFWLAALFVPTVAVAFKATLDFLRSPLGMALAIVGLGFLLFSVGWIGGDIRGTDKTRAAWKAANERAAQAKADNERKIDSTMTVHVDRALKTLDMLNKATDAKVIKNAVERPADLAGCRRATDDDIRRLFSIR